jgi:archaemetzincin
MRTLVARAGCALASCALAVFMAQLGIADASPSRARPIIYVLPLGDELPAADVAAVRAALVAFYAADVRVLPRERLPPASYTKARRRWRAERLLLFLRARMPADGMRILGLTGADISTTKGRFDDWGVMGLGEEPGVATVISSFRCRKKARDAAHARERLAKVAVHELGHSLGLDHCPTPGCLMHDAEGKVVTVDDEYDLCPRCRALLAAAGRRIPAAPAIPWPRPLAAAPP